MKKKRKFWMMKRCLKISKEILKVQESIILKIQVQPLMLKNNVGFMITLSLRENASNLAAMLYLIQERYPVNFRLIERTVKSVAPFFRGFDLKPMSLNPDYINLE